MSELSEILTSRIRLARFTSALLDAEVAAASMTPDRQPPRSCRLRISVEGATIGTGLIAVTGSTNENFAFTQNGIVVGEKDFTSIAGLAVSGISDGFIEVKAVSPAGQPVNQEYDVYASMAVRFYAISGKIRMMNPGQSKIAQYKIMCDYDKDIKENDTIYAISGIAGLTRGQISFVEPLYDFAGVTHHFEAEIVNL